MRAVSLSVPASSNAFAFVFLIMSIYAILSVHFFGSYDDMQARRPAPARSSRATSPKLPTLPPPFLPPTRFLPPTVLALAPAARPLQAAPRRGFLAPRARAAFLWPRWALATRNPAHNPHHHPHEACGACVLEPQTGTAGGVRCETGGAYCA